MCSFTDAWYGSQSEFISWLKDYNSEGAETEKEKLTANKFKFLGLDDTRLTDLYIRWRQGCVRLIIFICYETLCYEDNRCLKSVIWEQAQYFHPPFSLDKIIQCMLI